jgi:hypothetical protein
LLEPHRERLSRLFDQMLDVIENAFQARRIYLVRGVVVDAGADHQRCSKRASFMGARMIASLEGVSPGAPSTASCTILRLEIQKRGLLRRLLFFHFLR